MASQLTEVAEPAVISDALIRTSIVPPPGLDGAQLPKDKKEEKVASMTLQEITTLCFSFQNILKIDNLATLEGLTKLQLDNNIIETIQNLEHLTNLQWLDLSFNNISEISGLSTLTKLTDLSLYSNRISKLQNLDDLKELNVLSVGKNDIKSLDNFLYLRRFPQLRLLNGSDNPISKDAEYTPFVIAHLPGLKYFDFRLVEENEVVSAREQYIEDLIDIEEKEKAALEQEEKQKESASTAEQLATAYLTGVNTLHDDMFTDDPEGDRLAVLAFWGELVDEFKENAQELSVDFVKNVLEGSKERDAEQDRFMQALDRSRNGIEDVSVQVLAQFSKEKKKVFRSLSAEVPDISTGMQALDELKQLASHMQDDLLEIELHQAEEEEQLLLEFERNFGELVQAYNEQVSGHFMKIRDLEKALHEKAQALAIEEIEKFASNQAEDASEEVAAMLQDKEALMTSVNATHDLHLSRIDGKEDYMLGSQSRAFKAQVDKERQHATARNRSRINEIAMIVEQGLNDISEWANALQDTD